MIKKTKNKDALLLVLFLTLLFVVKHFLIFVSFNKGFDLIDEGSHLLFYNYPEKYPITFHNYQYFVSLLSMQFLSISRLRFLGWLIEIIGALILTAGICTYFKPYFTNGKQKYIFILFCLSSIGLSMHDRMIGYNLINLSLTYSSFGCLLLTVSSNELRIRNSFILLAVGLMMSLVLFVKMTTFFILIPIIILLIYIHRNQYLKTYLTALLVGSVLGILLCYTIITNTNPNWLSDFKIGFNLGRTSGYGNIQILLMMYLFDSLLILLKIAFSIAIPVFIYKKSKFKNNNKNTMLLFFSSIVMLIGSSILTSKPTYYVELHQTANNYIYDAPILFIHFIVFLFVLNRFIYSKKWIFLKDKKNLIVFIGLLFIPFANFFGAFSTILESFYAYLLPILALLFLLVIKLEANHPKVKLKQYVFYTSATLCFMMFIQVKWLFPSRLLMPIKYQTEKIETLKNIQLDQPTAAFIDALNVKTKHHATSNKICYIGNYSGAVYLLNKIQVGTTLFLSFPYFGEYDLMNESFNRYFYKQYESEINESILLISAGVLQTNLHNNSKDGVLDNNSHYLADSVYNPFLEKEMVVNELIERPYTYIYYPNKK